MDFFDVDLRVYSRDSAEELNNENLTAYNQVETVPSRHVSFAETVEKVELDPAMHAAPLPVVDYNASASTMAYRAPETTMTLPATTPLVPGLRQCLRYEPTTMTSLKPSCSALRKKRQ